MRRLLALAAALSSLALPAAARADAPPPGAKWSQAYITEAEVKLESYRADAPFEVPADTLAEGTDPALSIPTVSDCA
jgi:hypothetical protein